MHANEASCVHEKEKCDLLYRVAKMHRMPSLDT